MSYHNLLDNTFERIKLAMVENNMREARRLRTEFYKLVALSRMNSDSRRDWLSVVESLPIPDEE